jgi:hypothetical protein
VFHKEPDHLWKDCMYTPPEISSVK